MSLRILLLFLSTGSASGLTTVTSMDLATSCVITVSAFCSTTRRVFFWPAMESEYCFRWKITYDTIRLLTYGSRKSWIITTHIHVHKIHLRHIVITNKIESLKISQWIWYKGFKKTSCRCMTVGYSLADRNRPMSWASHFAGNNRWRMCDWLVNCLNSVLHHIETGSACDCS